MTIETRALLASRYVGPHAAKAKTHAFTTEALEQGGRSLCGRVDSFGAADQHATDPSARPTCAGCARKLGS
jgi:hypothetical protein